MINSFLCLLSLRKKRNDFSLNIKILQNFKAINRTIVKLNDW